MKKSLLYTIIGGACLLTTTSLTLIASGVEHANDTNSNQTLVATTTTLDTTPKSFTKNETVYVITDTAGHQVKSFVGNTINTSSEPIPIDMKITYKLDNTEISAEELVGKSGHVKVIYDFSATKYYNNTKIPFLTVTGILLDSAKFKNVKVNSGKTISESEDHTILAGYTMPGLNEDLGIDLLPTSFSFEADVDNFALETTYTFATSEIFADLDTSMLNSVDDLIGQLNQLSNSFDQIIDGSNKLATGLDSATNGAKALQAGINALANGANQLSEGADELATGSHALENGAYQLSDGLGQVVDVDNQIIDKIDEITAKVTAKYEELAARIDRTISMIRWVSPRAAEELANIKAQLETQATDLYNNAYGKVTTYTGGIEALYDGANRLAAGLTELSNGADALASGANQLASGANELSIGSGTLVNGLEQLDTGSHTLYNGLITFKEQGLNKLTNFANNSLANLTNNIRSTVSAAKSYHYYSNSDAKSVKFIFKTPSLK